MSYSYRVLKRGFFAGTLRDPDGKHDPVVVDKKLNPCPSWLELIDAKRPRRKPAANKDAAPAGGSVQGVKMKGEDVKFDDEVI